MATLTPSATGAGPAARRIPGTEVPCYVFDSNRDLAAHVARLVAKLIRERQSVGAAAVLGLPTGSTPVGVYRELVRMHREEGLDFSNVVTFNLDEYFGLPPDRQQSYHRWMREHLFAHVNVPERNIHIPEGMLSLEEVDDSCLRYEAAIERAGGIDLLLLGIGRNGHIGFNEPLSGRRTRTRLARLDSMTRKDAANDFYHEQNVPTMAVTMGIATILEARKIVLIAQGEHKARIVREAVEGPETDRVPASLLREHPDACFLLDGAAAGQLTGIATPWALGNVAWNDGLTKRAVLWLSETTGKALLKLDEQDFREHNLHQLLRREAPAQQIAHRVFRWMMDTINYHPAGREPRRVICFSPHPDDDVISMGGTLIRLIEDGHDVHVAYMTSGNIAVFDHDARRVADLVVEFCHRFGIDDREAARIEAEAHGALAAKAPGEADTEAVLRIKSLIRWSEAKSAAFVCGCREDRLHFLDLPFYRTGTIAKRPLGEDDVELVRKLIEELDPAQVYVAGDLSDPHGTHRMCANAVFQALARREAAGRARPEVLLYRGAWQEWAPHEIDLAVPLSPGDLERKKTAIFRHQSQKDVALFPGPDDAREFWQRAWDRNRNTANLYNQLGLPEYFAIEGFVRWDGLPL